MKTLILILVLIGIPLVLFIAIILWMKKSNVKVDNDIPVDDDDLENL
jgi:hypothetical protein